MEKLSEMEQNIYRLAEELNLQERKIVDFSISTNPLGVSNKIKTEIRKHLKYLDHYPDPDTKRLRKRLAQYHGIDPEMILCGNGSTELLYLMMRVLKPKSVLVPAPTYSGYERAFILMNQKSEIRNQKLVTPTLPSPSKGEGESIRYFFLNKENGFVINPDEFISSLLTPNSELGTTQCDMAFLCNPNNPTGRLLKKGDVLKIAEAAKELQWYLVVDEAFIDFCPQDSVINEVRNNLYLIVLRSFTNFYALAGLRLGYGVFPQALVERIREYKEPWTINSLAQRAAVIALKDKVYRKETFRLLKEEKQFLEKSFKKLGLAFFPSDANFYLLKISNANKIYQQLKKKGILVRDCSDFRGLDNTYIRVSVKSHRENTLLIKELTMML